MQNMLIKVGVNAVALWVAALVVTGVRLGEDADKLSTRLLTILLVALIFGVVNALVKPIAKVLAFPAIVLTLGLGIWIVNACLLYFVGRGLISGFHVTSFGSAMLGSLIISVTNLVMNRLFTAPPKPPAPRPPGGGKRDDVIDI